MGEVARPGLKLHGLSEDRQELSRWNGRGGPSGFETCSPAWQVYRSRSWNGRGGPSGFETCQAGYNSPSARTVGMGEVARPGLKPQIVATHADQVPGWNGRGGPSGFETLPLAVVSSSPTSLEWVRWAVRV